MNSYIHTSHLQDCASRMKLPIFNQKAYLIKILMKLIFFFLLSDAIVLVSATVPLLRDVGCILPTKKTLKKSPHLLLTKCENSKM